MAAAATATRPRLDNQPSDKPARGTVPEAGGKQGPSREVRPRQKVKPYEGETLVAGEEFMGTNSDEQEVANDDGQEDAAMSSADEEDDAKEAEERQQMLDATNEGPTILKMPSSVEKIYRDIKLQEAMQNLWYDRDDQKALAVAVRFQEKIAEEIKQLGFEKTAASERRFPLEEILGNYEIFAPDLEEVSGNPDARTTDGKRLSEKLGRGAATYTINMTRLEIPFELYVPSEKYAALLEIIRENMQQFEFLQSLLRDYPTERAEPDVAYQPMTESIRTLMENPNDKESEMAIVNFNRKVAQPSQSIAEIPLSTIKRAGQRAGVAEALAAGKAEELAYLLAPEIMMFIAQKLPMAGLPTPIRKIIEIEDDNEIEDDDSETRPAETASVGRDRTAKGRTGATSATNRSGILTEDGKVVVGYLNAGGNRHTWLVEGEAGYLADADVGATAGTSIFGKIDGKQNPNATKYNLKSKKRPTRGEEERFKKTFKQIVWVWSSPYKTRTATNHAFPKANIKSLHQDGSTSIETRTNFCKCLGKKNGNSKIEAWYDAKGITKPWEVEAQAVSARKAKARGGQRAQGDSQADTTSVARTSRSTGKSTQNGKVEELEMGFHRMRLEMAATQKKLDQILDSLVKPKASKK